MYKKMIPLAFLGLFLAGCAGEAEKAATSSETPLKTEHSVDPYVDLKAPELPQQPEKPKVQHEVVGQHYSIAYASTFEDYYFFDDGRFIYTVNSEYSPSVLTGEWSAEGSKISFKEAVHYYGKPTGKMIPPCGSVCIYDDYGMRVENSSQAIDPIDIKVGQGEEIPFEVSPHGLKSSDIHAFLREVDSKRKYPEVSKRPLQPSELKDKTAEELRLMRNEVFAAYGYKFKDEALAKHFRNQEFYSRSTDVDAFLSPLEKDNVALIKKVEAIKAK
ncbi:YARHG domain-containing protein [Saprospira sp. CCB-QB6]|uniref:YARHG domain-containing protein n=1 Tax=Saprospira sp. CCB-QB6 TaxID=3023936 RepID=UPI002348F0F0|nr:YARHG domain-containing protein [Saprospira sp. CCB-QB6]WCL81096.1 YARHG domain-containing protein [Saprospira sp. CCB-QB6]